MKKLRLKQAPFKISVALYERCCRGQIDALSRRAAGDWGIAVDEDADARWWQAWNEAGLRQIWGGCFSGINTFALSPVPARENGEPAAARILAPLSPVRSRPAAAGKRKPRGRRILRRLQRPNSGREETR